jgi:type I restriction enzyme S subunit
MEMPGFPVKVPGSIAEQRAIAGVLGALDDKIEQNRRTARALEQLAQATFRAWFVDFEPVKAKADGSTSFPSMPQPVFDALPTRFVDSDIGPVPEEWRVLTIGELAHRIAMGPFGSDIKRENFISEGVPVIRGGNLTDGFVDEDFVYLSEAKADQLKNANAFPGDVVITHRGTLGQVGLIPLQSRYRRYVVSQSQMLIRPNPDALPPHLLYLFLTSAPGQHALLANRSQTGVPAISRPTQSIKAIRFVLADAWFSNAFESMVAALFECRGGIVRESRKLADLRDYLLPKLLSGAVRVKEAERVLETTP